MSRWMVLLLVCATMVLTGCQVIDEMGMKAAGWHDLFNGENLDGWKASENKETFTVKDGMIVAHGERSHLFYVGPVKDANFTNFELLVEVMTKPQANSGIYFHTEYQEEGWPDKGYEVQVNNTHTDWRKTGGLYAVVDVKEPPAKDGEWFKEYIRVRGNRIVTKVNDKLLVDYTEPEEVQQNGQPNQPNRKISSGTFALQGHDPGSIVYYKSIKVRPLR